MSLRAAGRTALAGLSAAAVLGLAAPAALADSHEVNIATTIADHEARIRLLNSKSEQYRQSANDSRARAARYRNQRDGKMRKINTPEHKQQIENLEEAAKNADELANDLDRLAHYHQLQIDEMKK
jgi:hypothetical protein